MWFRIEIEISYAWNETLNYSFTLDVESRLVCFNLTSVSCHDPILHGKLKLLYRRHINTKNYGSKNFTIVVYVNGTEVAKRSFDVTNSSCEQHLTLNVRKIVKKYVINGKESICFDIKVKVNETTIPSPHLVGVVKRSANCSHHPFLIVYQNESTKRKRDVRAAAATRINNLVGQLYDMTAAAEISDDEDEFYEEQRERRSATVGEHVASASVAGSAAPTPDADSPRRRQCRRKTLNITLDSIGLADWILSPRQFDGGVCRGECRYPIAENNEWNTNHGALQAAMHHRFSDRIPKVLCTPAAFAELAVLYFPQPDVLKHKRHPNMVVTHCGCR